MVEQLPDGRWMVDLTDLRQGSDQSAVVGAVAGVNDRFGSIDALAPRRMLLVLDNCEHVLDGTRSYLIEVLAAAPGVTVLATSREALGIPR
jgi:predicted ATPase